MDDLQKIEEDMQIHERPSDDWLVKLFAENPLIGNKIISEEIKEDLFSTAKNYIDNGLQQRNNDFTLKEKRIITLAIITYAKEWNTGDESSFWNYITVQFGYREIDETNKLRKMLCDCIYDAITKSGRWFIESKTDKPDETVSSGTLKLTFLKKGTSHYKSTIVVHALATKHSWMLLYDFLFDFYKANMNWTYIENDPIIARMVVVLKSKLSVGKEDDDNNLEISTNIYYFQEGIKKLIIYRTGYAIKLINHMLGRIHNIINHRNTLVKLYIDELCDQWFEGKLQNNKIINGKSSSSLGMGNVAIDYTRIRPTYVLKDEMNVVIQFPDVRLKKTEFKKIVLQVYVGDINVETRSLNFYGNELGKTLSGFNIDMNMCLRRGDGSLNVKTILVCDDEEIYNSKDTLYRECLCFEHKKECDIRECQKGSYSFFVTTKNSLEFQGADVSNIDETDFWNSYYAELGSGFCIKLNNQIVSLDSGDRSSAYSTIRAIYPTVDTLATFIKNGRRYNIVAKESEIILMVKNKEDLQKCEISMNANKVELLDMSSEETANGLIYKLPMHQKDDKTCEFQIIDLEKNMIISRKDIKVISGLSVQFNRAFYLMDKDFDGAMVTVITNFGHEKRFDINSDDEVISFVEDGGTIEIKVPKVIVRDAAGQIWDYGYTTWLKDVQQNEKIYISLPLGSSAYMKVGNIDVTEVSKGCFDFGNAVFALSYSENTEWINIKIVISKGPMSEEYMIGRISPKEQFTETVRFKYRDNTLFWNCGKGFIGNKNGLFKLKIETEKGIKEYPLNLDDEVVVRNPDLLHNEYKCKIVKESDNIFSGEEKVLYTGLVLIGDNNELRFHNYMIRIRRITYEENGSVEIQGTYIDQIKYEGIQFVASECRECPVYSGILFYMGQSHKHHEFSYEEDITEQGLKKYKINPVKIIYINKNILSITNEDGDGLYYFKNFDKVAKIYIYRITDREPNNRNQNTYYLADLYTYDKEKINVKSN